MTRTWAMTGIALLALLVAALGLYIAGGPAEARKDRRDARRLADLNAMADLVVCLARADGDRLPQAVQSTPQCSAGGALTDPLTDRPYDYEILSPTSFRLCADYELRFPGRNCMTRLFFPNGQPPAPAMPQG